MLFNSYNEVQDKTCVAAVLVDVASNVYQALARGGHLAVLQWARENHCRRNWQAMAYAARGRACQTLLATS
jgi:hypothetical protein